MEGAPSGAGGRGEATLGAARKPPMVGAGLSAAHVREAAARTHRRRAAKGVSTAISRPSRTVPPRGIYARPGGSPSRVRRGTTGPTRERWHRRPPSTGSRTSAGVASFAVLDSGPGKRPTPRVTSAHATRARPAANGHPDGAGLAGLLDRHVHRHDDPQVQEGGDDRREHGDDRQPGGPRLDRGGDHVELGEEARRERHAGLGEEEQGEGEGQQRAVAREAAVVVEAVADVALAAHHRDDAEAARHHERVGGQVEERRLDALARWPPARPRG